MILPLATRRDKQTQIRWGLRDFERRFGRRSEGFWLPETAVDAETLQLVAAEGIRFLILAPHQALRFRRIGERRWEAAAGGIDTSRAYRCFLDASRRRWMDCFFYDGALSVAASFEHLLRDAGTFTDRLAAAGEGMRPEGLVHMATDGEVYGHHEPFADMCLAYLFSSEGPRRGLRFVNYPEYLDLQPPEYEVVLNFTDTGEGTAWSCAHGVGRWSRDCGCYTGGQPDWNQRWRAPLRRGLDAIREQIHGAYLTQAGRHFADAWAARDDYIEVLRAPDPAAREAFLQRHLRVPAGNEERRMLWALLEATHQAMLMYTSCAWFFSDISGLEVQQNLGYAARACELAQPYVAEPLEPLLLMQLEHAKSNLPEWRDGSWVYRRLVRPRRIGPEYAGAQAALEAAVLDRSLDRPLHVYDISGRLDPEGCGPEADCTGHLRVTEPRLEQSWSWDFRVTPGSLAERRVELRPAVDPQASVGPAAASFGLVDFQQETREEIAQAALSQALDDESDRIRQLYEEVRPPMEVLVSLQLPLPEIHRRIAEHVLGRALRDLADQVGPEGSELPAAWWDRVEGTVLEMRRLSLRPDSAPLATALAERVHLLLDRAQEERSAGEALAAVRIAYDTLRRADRLELPLKRTWIEPRVYELVLRFRSDLIRMQTIPVGAVQERAAGAPASGAWPTPEDQEFADLEALRDLAGHANLQLDAILREEGR